VAKRSPILGYNHNVRYRGIIFHVQTEDSGVLSPHLFTHLFHAGVIVSTRKLVYDAGSDEGAIKSLMQAQHKAVMKDLKKGTFDDKIDLYLAGTEGLLPRGVTGDEPGDRDSQPALPDLTEATPAPESDATLKTPAFDLSSLGNIDVNATLKGTTPNRAKTTSPPTELDEDLARYAPQLKSAPEAARTRTAERGSAPSRNSMQPPPPSDDLDGPTSLETVANTSVPAYALEAQAADSLNAIIELQLEDRPSGRSRPRDTDIVLPGVDPEPSSDGVPGIVGASTESSRPRSANESVPPLPPPPASSRPSAAGSLLPPRPPTRPPARPAITPPQVLSRPITREDRGGREDSDAIEVYAPAPPSADAPPGLAASERPGQYSQHKKVSQKLPALEPAAGRGERSGGVPIPPGLGRPGNRIVTGTATPPKPPPTPPPRTQTPVPQVTRPDPSSGAARPRTPTPGRTTGPMTSRPGSVSSVPNSGVVMTRPAVIVGAPAKPAPPRVRKAREDEGRGFGQGLISEKSLDEVILAYLSEDADDK
jgi:hypothetical protein